MPRYSAWDDDDDDERDWSAGAADEEALDEDSDEPTFACPACGRHIYEGAHACPHCGEYLIEDDAYGWNQRPWWVWAGAIVALAVMLISVVLMLLGLAS